jgi:hypothetical protein
VHLIFLQMPPITRGTHPAPALLPPPAAAATSLSSLQVTKELDERSLYASPFPYDSSLDAITSFFQQHAPVKSVRMRRHLTSKDFKGSVFVEFAAKEEAEKVGRRGVWWPGSRGQVVYGGRGIRAESGAWKSPGHFRQRHAGAG